MHALAFDQLLRALTASKLKIRVLRDKDEWLMLLEPLVAPSFFFYFPILSFFVFGYIVVDIRLVFFGDQFEVKFGILWSPLMGRITFLCLLYMVVLCYWWCFWFHMYLLFVVLVLYTCMVLLLIEGVVFWICVLACVCLVFCGICSWLRFLGSQ